MENSIIGCVEQEYLRFITSDKFNEHNDTSFWKAAKLLIDRGVKTLQVITDESQIRLVKKLKNKFPQLVIIAGGNIQSSTSAKAFLQAGADYIVIERYFQNHPNKIGSFSKIFGKHLIASISDNSTIESLLSQISLFKKNGVRTILYVNEKRKLLTEGVSIDNFSKIRGLVPSAHLIYSGGVTQYEDIKRLCKTGADSILIGTALYTHTINPIKAEMYLHDYKYKIIKCIKDVNFTKSRGLVPAVIQDNSTKNILMLGYMNTDALRRTLKTRKVHFWSRSRQEIWFKGKKSKNFLLVHSISLDCDQDALLISVSEATRSTPICHTGSNTCFLYSLL